MEDKLVWVVMGNDYPDAVFDDEAAADAFIARKLEEAGGDPRRIYWRTYEFPLRSVAV